MSCERFSKAISDYACGETLDAATASHLAACEACRERLTATRRNVGELEDWLQRSLAITASPEFSARVSAHVRAAARPPAALSRWWMGAAAAAALAMAIYLVPSGDSGRPPSERIAERAEPPAGQPELQQGQTSPGVQAALTGAGAAQPEARPGRAAQAPHRSDTSAPVRAARTARADARVVSNQNRRPELEVLVEPGQARAIARLRELAASGAIDYTTIAEPPERSATEALVIPPLTVPEIVIPDVWTEGGSGFSGEPAA